MEDFFGIKIDFLCWFFIEYEVDEIVDECLWMYILFDAIFALFCDGLCGEVDDSESCELWEVDVW
mgnify:FL=1